MAHTHGRKRLPPDYVRLSTFISLVLRHEPHSVGLVLDGAGWASVDDLLRVTRPHLKGWHHVDVGDLEFLIANSEIPRPRRRRFS
ncbi:MAG: hypothetical protein GXX96_17315 [Planctomycetaceae bacterium]|nr:hypothetical protein [Planctomycetaceae bacterium]